MYPKKLPLINLQGEAFFFDLRLSQLRKVNEPHKFVDLSHDQAKNFVEALLYLEVAERHNDSPSASEEQA